MADMDYNYSGEVVSGVEPAKKRTGAVIGGITAGVLVVAVGGGVAAYSFSDLVKNQVKLTISKPEDYYTWVTEKNTNEFASQLAESYRTYIKEQKNGAASNVVLNFDLSDEAKSLLSENAEDFPEINSVALGVSSKFKDNAMNADAHAEINGNNVISIETAMNYDAMEVFFRIPGLSDQWIFASDDIDEEDMAMVPKDMESIITPEELESLIVKYADLYNSCVSDIEIEKKEEVAIGDITVKYTVAEMALTEEKADAIAEKFLNEFKNDELIKNILVERTKSMTEEEFNEEIDSALEDIKEASDAGDISVKTYIDAKGCIRGMSATDTQNAENDMRFIIGQQESEIRGEFLVSDEDSEEDTRMDISLTEKSEKSYDGTITMTVDGDEVSAEITGLTVVDEKNGYMSGNVSVSAEGETISVALSTEDNAQIVTSDINVAGTNYGKLTVKLSTESGAEPVLPDKSAAYDMYGEEADFPSDYIEQDKMVEFAKNVLINIGLDEETADGLAVEFGESIYYTYEEWDDEEIIGGADEIVIEDEDFDLDFDVDDEDLHWEDLEFDDPYADDMVYPDDNDAYVIVMDESGAASYMGYGESLSYNAKVAEIKGAGTYTVSVTADSDGYKEYTGNIMPDGFSMLGFEAYGEAITADTEISVKSIKVDGKELELTGEPFTTIEDGTFSVLFYLDQEIFGFEDVENCIDLKSFGEWTDIEITFEVK